MGTHLKRGKLNTTQNKFKLTIRHMQEVSQPQHNDETTLHFSNDGNK